MSRDSLTTLCGVGHNETHGTHLTLDDFYCKSHSVYYRGLALTISPRLLLLEGQQHPCLYKRRRTENGQNPGWGTPEETFFKVEEFYHTDRLDTALPIDGALEGLLKLRSLGFRMVVVTARQRRELERSKRWIDKHFSGIFEDMICTGQSQETLAETGDVLTKLSKAEVDPVLFHRYHPYV